jgi:hypothetical protein
MTIKEKMTEYTMVNRIETTKQKRISMQLHNRICLLIICALLAVGTPVFADELDQLQALDHSEEETLTESLDGLDEIDDQNLTIENLEDNSDGLSESLADDETLPDELPEQDFSLTFSGYIKAMAYWNRTIYSDDLWAQFKQLKVAGFSSPDDQKKERYSFTGVRTQLQLEGYLGDRARLFAAFNLDFNEADQTDSSGYDSTTSENEESRSESIRMVERYIEIYEKSRTWKVGTQLVTWSYLEGFETPTDRLNARDQSYPSSEYEDTKLPSTGMLLTQGIGDNTFELMAIPVGQVNINPTFTNYLYTGGQFKRKSKPESSKWATRFSGSLHKLDYAVSYIDGTDREADVDLLDTNGKAMVYDSSKNSLQLLADMSTYNRPARTYHRVRSPGLDLQYNFGSWIPKLSYIQNLTEDENGDNPFVKNSWSQYLVGGEFKISAATINLYAGQKLVEDYKEERPLDLKTNFLSGQRREQTDILSGYVNANFLTGDALRLTLMFANYWDKEGTSVESKLKTNLKYKITDGLEIYFAYSYFNIEDTEISDVQAEVKYSF